MDKRKSSIFGRGTMHPRDAERFARPGGMFGGRRFYNDPPPYEAQELPEAFRGSDPALKDFKTLGSLRKAYLDTKAHVGQSIRIPSPDAGPEAIAETRDRVRKAFPDLVEVPKDPEKRKAVEDSIWETLGRPKEAKGYEPPADVQLPAEALEQLRKDAQEEGLTAAQFQRRAKKAADQFAAMTQAQKDANLALRAEFGAAYDDRMKEIAVIAEKTSAPAQLRDAIAKGQIDKATAAYFLGLSKSLGIEPREVAGQRDGHGAALTPAEAERQINEILRNPAFLKPSDPDHGRLVKRLAELEAYASPELARASGD